MGYTSYTKFILSYSFAFLATIIFGFLLNENRVDLYISLYILEYFVFSAIYGVRLSTTLNIILFIIFMIIVAYRIIEILFPGVLF